MFKLDQVSFAYQDKIIFDSLSLKLAEGKITCLIGPNGSGKSTLFKLFTRTLKPQAGKVILDQDIWQLSPKEFAQKVAIVHQNNKLYDEMKVADLVEMGRLPYHGQAKENFNLDKVYQKLELTALKDSFINDLSGGQQQRVWLAAALSQDPEYLFLDEPTTYLDLHYQYQFLHLIKQINREQNLTIFMILHDLNQALQFSDQVVLLNQGQIVQIGRPSDVITSKNINENFKINSRLVQVDGQPFLIEN